MYMNTGATFSHQLAASFSSNANQSGWSALRPGAFPQQQHSTAQQQPAELQQMDHSNKLIVC
jgi:hypothetical protein